MSLSQTLPIHTSFFQTISSQPMHSMNLRSSFSGRQQTSDLSAETESEFEVENNESNEIGGILKPKRKVKRKTSYTEV